MDPLVVRLCRLRIDSHYAPKLACCLKSLRDHDLTQAEPAGHSIEGLVNHILSHLKLAVAWAGEDAGGVSKIPVDIRSHFPGVGTTADTLASEAEDAFSRLSGALKRIEKHPSVASDFDLQRLLHLVEHVSYHLGQLVLLAKTKTGTDFAFAQSGLNEAQLRELEANESQRTL